MVLQTPRERNQKLWRRLCRGQRRSTTSRHLVAPKPPTAMKTGRAGATPAREASPRGPLARADLPTGDDFTQLSVMRRGDRRERTRPGEGTPLAGRDHGISGHDVLRMLCDGHGCRRRDSPHALNIRPTNGRLDPSPEDFDLPKGKERAFKVIARGCAISAGNYRRSITKDLNSPVSLHLQHPP